MELLINIDGGSRGNPGPGASGVVIRDKGGNYLLRQGWFFKKCTNNQAEFKALKLALARAKNLGGTILNISSDSELLVKQFNGLYKIKNPELKLLMDGIKKDILNFKKVTLVHVLREKNKEADLMCNLTMDEAKKNNFNDNHLYTLLATKPISKEEPSLPVQLELF